MIKAYSRKHKTVETLLGDGGRADGRAMKVRFRRPGRIATGGRTAKKKAARQNFPAQRPTGVFNA